MTPVRRVCLTTHDLATACGACGSDGVIEAWTGVRSEVTCPDCMMTIGLCPHGRTDGQPCYGHTDPAKDCPPPCCELHRDGDAQPRTDCHDCMASLRCAATYAAGAG